MKKVMFFIDGYYMYSQLRYFESSVWIEYHLLEYCNRHIADDEYLVRIFYYDAPPVPDDIKNPLGNTCNFSSNAVRIDNMHNSIRKTPYVTFRIGMSSWHGDWVLKKNPMEQIISGKMIVDQLKDNDFFPVIKQKSVDMYFGVDIASVSLKKQADRIVMIANDLDFKPAIEFAKNEGVQVTLDPVGGKVNSALEDCVDWIENKLEAHEIKSNQERFWIHKKILKEANSRQRLEIASGA